MFRPITDQQAKFEIDAQQTYEALCDAETKLQSYAGGMHWKRVGATDYLYKTLDRRGNAKSLGPRSADTEAMLSAFVERKDALTQRAASLRDALASRTALAKAVRVGAAPNLLGAICERLTKADLMGNNIVIIGTNALYAYEALAGVRFDEAITATEDIDLLWNVKAKLSVVGRDIENDGLLGLLKRVDSTFELMDKQRFRAVNGNGYMVDLIKQTPDVRAKNDPVRLGRDAGDFTAAEIPNMDWMLSAPRIRQIVLSQNGRPFEMAVPDPRAFMLFKTWLSQEPTRNPAKRSRDARQAEAVGQVLAERLPQFPFEWDKFKSFPSSVIEQQVDGDDDPSP